MSFVQKITMTDAKVKFGSLSLNNQYQVHFAGINFADTLMRLGLYQPRPPFPFTPGYEVSGVVHAMGKRVEGFEIGQRVVGLMRTGGQASHVIADASRTLPIPDEISLEAAASMNQLFGWSVGKTRD